MEEEQSQQRELALEKDKMAAAFDNLKNLVEEDADTEAEYVKVKHTGILRGYGVSRPRRTRRQRIVLEQA